MSQLDIRAETEQVDSILFADELKLTNISDSYCFSFEDTATEVNFDDIDNLILALKKVKELRNEYVINRI